MGENRGDQMPGADRFDLGARLRALRVGRGVAAKDVAALTGSRPSSVSNWEHNYARPPLETLRQLCAYYGVSANELLDVRTDASGTAETEDEKWLLHTYRAFSGGSQRFIRRVMKAEYERIGEDDRPEPLRNTRHIAAPRRILMIDEFPQTAAAGAGDWLSDEQPEKTRLYATPETRRADMIIRVSGHSMEPEYPDGCRLLVARRDRIDVGAVGVFTLNGCGYVKAFGGDRLVSLNKKYRDIPLCEDDDLRCNGVVLGVVQPYMDPEAAQFTD